MVDLVEHHYHLSKPIRKHTLRELRRKVTNIPFVNPHLSMPEEGDTPGGSSSPPPDDHGTLFIPS